MNIEAMKLALEALETAESFDIDADDGYYLKAITALQQSIEQAQKQKPDKYVMDIECTNCGTKQSGILTVNTTPPQRQPLTDEQISDLWCKVSNTDFVTADTHEFARAIEAAHGIKGEA